MKAVTTSANQAVCNPCRPISQIKRFNAGDKVRVKTSDAGYVKGAVLVIYGFCSTPEGTNIYIPGNTPFKVRDAKLYAAGLVRESMFVMPRAGIAEVPVLTAEEYLEFIPVGTIVSEATEDEAVVIQMNPDWTGEMRVAA